MADPDHLAELNRGIESWNQWRKSHFEANLARAHIEGAQLEEVHLGEAHLEGVHLYRAHLERANLCKAHLEWAHLEGANLKGADLEGANLYRAHLEGANLCEAHLEGANLQRAQLERTHLEGVHLEGVYLEGANLEGANLRGATLRRVHLEWANLRDVDLEGADLREAHLEGADLEGAHLEGADLEGANLEGASCGSTYWVNLNLTEASGLSALIHSYESHLSTNTLALAKGRLPTEFLKGCGLADWEIESAKLYDPDLTTAETTEIQYRIYDLLARGPIQISPVFISYSHADTEFVDSLGNMLDKKGVRYWRDIKDATAGRLDKVIDRGISLNPTLLLVLSKHSIESDWVEYEVDKACELRKKLKRDVLCPIMLDKAWLTSDRISGNLRAQIKKYNVLDFSQHQDATTFSNQFRKLLDGLGLHYRDLKPAGTV